jgi:hypothetical protein
MLQFSLSRSLLLLDVGETLELYWLLDEETNNVAILIEQVSPLI